MKEAIKVADSCGDMPQLLCQADRQHAAAQAVTFITILHGFDTASA
jgi:hypothetical protein